MRGTRIVASRKIVVAVATSCCICLNVVNCVCSHRQLFKPTERMILSTCCCKLSLHSSAVMCIQVGVTDNDVCFFNL